MKCCRYLVRLIAFSLCLVGSAGASQPLKKGFINNDQGKPCWYKQTAQSESRYFHEGVHATVHVLTFDDPRCMADSGLGLDINKRQINNVIGRWYSHPDAAFQTRVRDLRPGSLFQVRGQCMQSQKYPAIGIAIEYETRNSSIVRVYHTTSVQGCK